MHPFTDDPAAAVSSLGEQRLISAIRGWLGSASPKSPYGIGDDCAVVPASTHRQLVTVDPVIYGEHINDSVSPAAAGAKLFKRNLSDIAAMGGRPRAAVVALAMDRRVKIVWLRAFYRSLAAISRRYDVPVVGGDIAHHAGGIVASLTLIGEAPHGRVVTRAGAKCGDHIYVTGRLGGSILGHHHRFAPRMAEGAWLAQRAEVRSLTDISDGIGKDLRSLMPDGTKPALLAKDIPISAAARSLARRTGATPLGHALGDGEDYELLFTLARTADRTAFEAAWRKRFSTQLTRLGCFVRTNTPLPEAEGWVPFERHAGFEHLRPDGTA